MPSDGAVLDQERVDVESLPDLDTRCGGRVDKDLVQDGPTRCVAAAVPVNRSCSPPDRERSEVVGVGLDRRAAGGHDLVQEAPSRQRSDPWRMDDVGGEGVARERGPIDQQHAVPLAGEQHGSRCAGATGSDNDGVVGGVHGSSSVGMRPD